MENTKPDTSEGQPMARIEIPDAKFELNKLIGDYINVIQSLEQLQGMLPSSLTPVQNQALYYIVQRIKNTGK